MRKWSVSSLSVSPRIFASGMMTLVISFLKMFSCRVQLCKKSYNAILTAICVLYLYLGWLSLSYRCYHRKLEDLLYSLISSLFINLVFDGKLKVDFSCTFTCKARKTRLTLDLCLDLYFLTHSRRCLSFLSIAFSLFSNFCRLLSTLSSCNLSFFFSFFSCSRLAVSDATNPSLVW